MWIQVRSMDGRKSVRVDGLSKLSKIEELREKLVELFDATPERQRLFYRGKQLENGHTLFDYNVGLNEIVQIIVRPAAAVLSPNRSPVKKVKEIVEEVMPDDKLMEIEPDAGEESDSQDSGFEDSNSVYKMGDIIDARDPTMGAWFEAKIVKITKGLPVKTTEKSDSRENDSELNDPLTTMEQNGTCDNKVPDSCENRTDTDVANTHGEACTEEQEKVSSQLQGTVKGESISTDTEPQSSACSGKDDRKDSEEVKESKNSNGDAEQNSAKEDAESEVRDENGNEPAKMEISDSGTVPNGHSDSNEAGSTLPNEHTEPSESGSVENELSQKSSESAAMVKGYKDVFGEVSEDGYSYHVIFEGYEDDPPVALPSSWVRPRARHKISLDSLQIGDKVMVNYSYDEPRERGFWYDAVVTGKRCTRTIKDLFCTVFVGEDLVPIENCQIMYYWEAFKIEQRGTQQNFNTPEATTPVKRENKPECEFCRDKPNKKCKQCACHKCGGKDFPEKTLLCDECDMAYHYYCLDPPLESIPDIDEWYCPLCKNDENEVVRAGEKLKESKKKSKMASANSVSTRDWGKGMACVGRTKECRIVPPNHFGPIPGVEVGMMWKFRVQVSESGAHRPHVAGIHGREEDGAFSIVLSGGYEDDVDKGDEFTYTGSGGRDLSGNKRTAEQSCDQQLTRMNKALAKNCNAPIDSKKGAKAENWEAGKPVRVIRNCKGRKHSKYAPEEGNRYDGIYKVVKYWPAKGKSGFTVWRYLLRRDDPVPAPWTKEGKKRIKEMGFTIQYPEGYEEKQQEKEKSKKRKRGDDDDEDAQSPVKKKATYKVSSDVKKLIKEDTVNEKLWKEALTHTKEGSQKFLAKVEELFCCICCQDLVFKPVTTTCAHNVCKPCLSRSFKADVHTCPACRTELGKDYSMAMNKTLREALQNLFPGYEAGR